MEDSTNIQPDICDPSELESQFLTENWIPTFALFNTNR